ncbi:RteC domain-containing protein [Pedobacter miscanthi]|uniref:RteC domain-containing protein n=1 Tax=Pedobacter miscanthi TaxID=2259170 RepID=UPI00292FB174|nr:RteC domain-containing protein [Pedobacter miscanthi]
MGGIKKNEVLRLVEQMDKDVRRVYVAEITPLSRMRAVVLLVRNGLAQLSQVVENGFADSGEEIYFFKTLWPSVMGWQFYAADRFAIELARPEDVVEKVLGYLKGELGLAQQLFSRYPLQYAYFCQGMDELDGRYFVHSGEGGGMLLGVGFDAGDGLAPPCTDLWARFMAAERLRDYLLAELMRLELGKGETAGSPDQGKLAVKACENAMDGGEGEPN